MSSRSIALRETRGARGSRHLEATLHADGTLTIEGQDLGAALSESGARASPSTNGQRRFDRRMSRSWWLLSVAGEDVLEALAQRYSDDPSFILQRFLDEQGIPYEFWSRVGD